VALSADDGVARRDINRGPATLGDGRVGQGHGGAAVALDRAVPLAVGELEHQRVHGPTAAGDDAYELARRVVIHG